VETQSRALTSKISRRILALDAVGEMAVTLRQGIIWDFCSNFGADHVWQCMIAHRMVALGALFVN
jgi:hypothetical protein